MADVLTGRAAWLGLRRAGRTSANGSCRLLPAADGWVAVNLARPSDVEAVPALIERSVDGDPWAALARAVAGLPAAAVVERAGLLGLPVAALPADRAEGSGAEAGPSAEPGPVGTGPDEPGPFRAFRRGEARAGGTWPAGGPDGARPLVVDLSSMWAGPLCARLLGRAGLRVVKVESTARPDGARAGDARFYAWLHAGHESVALDLAQESGRRALRDLVGWADVVLESSRPRALAQLGVEAERVVAARPGVTWVSITGYGREQPGAGRVAFGDDAAVAAGLVARDDRGEPVFCADAVADPITGLYAAVGALASQAVGGGHLLEVAMVEAARFAAATPARPVAAVEAGPGRWVVPGAAGSPSQPVVPPAPPRLDPGALDAVRPLGADTGRLLAELRSPAAPLGGRRERGTAGGGGC
ncbi:MAG TPA: CoA transferase [Acidimicrobiales bacterium]